MRFPRFAYLLALFPMIFAGDCDSGTPPDGTLSGTDEIAASPEVRIQVIAVEPDMVAPGLPFKAEVFGSAFESGAEVSISGILGSTPTVLDPNTMTVQVAALSPGVHDVEVRNPSGETAILRGGINASASMRPDRTAGLECGRLVLPFDFDSFVVGEAAQTVLEDNFACFEDLSGPVRLEGHCDERGTTEYNLALGTRRASAVQRWLTSRGVLPGRIETVTYGEERPLAKGHDDGAWAQNRRVEVVVAR